MTEPDASTSRFSPRTVWARRLETPLRRFLRTETGSAAVLLAATLAALAWANIGGRAAGWRRRSPRRSGRGPGRGGELRDAVAAGEAGGDMM